MKKIWFIAVGCSIFCLACKNKTSNNNFLNASSRDTTINPADDFYSFANGTWYKKTTIPETQSSVGGFTDLYYKTQENLKNLITSLSKHNNSSGTSEQMIGDFFKAAMDSNAINKLGFEPIKPILLSINSLKTYKDLMPWMAERKKYNYDYLIAPYVGADEKNSNNVILSIYQNGLGLPERDYYFKTDIESKKVYNAYIKYVTETFKLIGNNEGTAIKNANTVYELEKKIASAHKTNVELRDPIANYNKLSVASIDKTNTNLGLGNYLTILGVKTDSINVAQVKFLAKLNELFASENIDTWKTYLTFHTLNASTSNLSEAFEKNSFEYSKVLSGQQKMKPRADRFTGSITYYLRDAIGQVYTKKYFPAEAKEKMLELVNNLQKAFEGRINNLSWMSDSTKQTAKQKMATFIKKIGYPNTWKNYKGVTISANNHFANLLSLRKYEHEYEFSKIGKPIDKTEWMMGASDVNAYYNPTFNEIVFPAAILQFPFFDLNADDAINYGGIGMVIGHEMTHGFDDQGAQYDKEGNLRNWWGKADFDKFNTMGNQVASVYSSFTVVDSLKIKGMLTLGENIADMGGLAIAYDAFKLTKQGQSTEKIGDYTPEQRFFLSLAQIWQEKMKDESLRTQVNTDPHSPARFRVMVPLMHFDPFYKAFNVQPNNKMYVAPNNRIKIW